MSTFTQPPQDDREDVIEPSTGIPAEGSAFFLQFIRDVSKDIVQALRSYYSTNPRTVEFRWVGKATENGIDTDQSSTKLSIAVQFAHNENFYPQLNVAEVTANFQDLFINSKVGNLVIPNPRFNLSTDDDFKESEFLEVGYRRSGKLNFTINLKIIAQNVPETDKIADSVIHGLVGPVRDELERKGYAWLPNQGRITQAMEENYTKKNRLFSRVVSFGLMGEWYDDFYYNTVTVEGVEGISTLVTT